MVIKNIRIIFTLCLVSLFLFTRPVAAQKLEITPFTGYLFAGSLNTNRGEILIQDGQNFGFLVNYSIDRYSQLEFMYNRLETNVKLRQRFDVTEKLFDMNQQYFNLGILRTFNRRRNIDVFGATGIGAALFQPYSGDYSDDWRFSFNFGAGVKIYFGERFGLRLQGRFLIPVYWTGGTIYVGGGGPGYGFSGGSSLIQGDLTAGLIVRL
jgi:hypothetical protein